MFKKLFTLIALTVISVSVKAQSCFWHENFDDPSLRDSCITLFNGTHGFAQNSRLFTSALYSDTAYIDVGDTIELRTDCFDLTGLTYAILSFNHICKVDFFDVAIVEISLDCGLNWFQLTSEYITDQVNPPGAPFSAQGYQFSAASYPVWSPGNPNAVPTNSWWKTEYFDISGWANLPDVRIRFIMWDSNIPGGSSNSGWAIDDICIVAAPCELTPPTLSFLPPLFINTVYNLGPYNVTVASTDNSGINNVTLFYSINGSPYTSVVMNNTQDSLYVGQIPAVNDGDTICYYVVSEDGSACFNQTTNPVSGCIQFIASQGISFPFCDNFDLPPPLFNDSTALGATPWQLGTPTNGGYQPVSSPNVWAVGLNTIYGNNANSFLYSPIFGNIPIGTKLSFWLNYNTETSWDGTRLEYSTDGGATWALLGDIANSCGCQANWYTNTIISSGNQPAWAGASNGWKKAEYTFPPTFPYGPNIQFRFIFTSDASVVVSHFAIDGFCIEIPQPFDAGIPSIVSPVGFAPAGSCQPVTVTLENFGLNPLTSFDVYYRVTDNQGNITVYGPFPWSGNLAPGATTQFTMPCFNFPSGGFTLCSWTDLVNDGNALNDTTCAPLAGMPTLTLSYTQPYCDNFEGPNIGWASQINTGGSPGTNWQLGTPAFGATTGAHSGVNAWDINLNATYTANANVSLYSPFFDMTNAIDTRLTFWRNNNLPASGDGVRLEYTLNQGLTWNLLGTLNATPPYVNWYSSNLTCANNQPGWSGNSSGWVFTQMQNLGAVGGAFNGQPSVQFRFTFCSDGFTQTDGFSLDDFCLEVPVPLTAAPVTIKDNAPTPLIFSGQTVQFRSHIKNRGTTPINEVEAQLWIDANLIGTNLISYSPALQSGDSLLHNFSFNWTATAGFHDVCVVTANPNNSVDQNPTDDTICYVIQVIDTISVTSAPYCNDFESGPQWVALSALNYSNNSKFELGAPNQTVLNSAHSGVNAWMTDLNNNYPNRDTSGLFTPAFTIDPAKTYKLSFWHQFNIEPFADGGAVDYSIDYGNTWQQLGGFNPSDWYNSPYIISFPGLPPGPGFTGFPGNYIFSQFENCFGSNAVFFRFRFMSDLSGTYEGWAIDDVCFQESGICPTGITEQTHGNQLWLGQNVPNPANDQTVIPYFLPEAGIASIEITDLLGKTVMQPFNNQQSQGSHYAVVNTADLKSGVYFYTLTLNGSKVVKRMVITR